MGINSAPGESRMPGQADARKASVTNRRKGKGPFLLFLPSVNHHTQDSQTGYGKVPARGERILPMTQKRRHRRHSGFLQSPQSHSVLLVQHLPPKRPFSAPPPICAFYEAMWVLLQASKQPSREEEKRACSETSMDCPCQNSPQLNPAGQFAILTTRGPNGSQLTLLQGQLIVLIAAPLLKWTEFNGSSKILTEETPICSSVSYPISCKFKDRDETPFIFCIF